MKLRVGVPCLLLVSGLALTACDGGERDSAGSVDLSLVVAPGVTLD